MNKIGAVLCVWIVVMFFCTGACADYVWGSWAPYYQQDSCPTCGGTSLKMWLCSDSEDHNPNCGLSAPDLWRATHGTECGRYFETSPTQAKNAMDRWGQHHGYYIVDWAGTFDSGTRWLAYSAIWGHPSMALTYGCNHWMLVKGVTCKDYGCNNVTGVYVNDPWKNTLNGQCGSYTANSLGSTWIPKTGSGASWDDYYTKCGACNAYVNVRDQY